MNYFEINSFSTGRLDSKLLERGGDDFFKERRISSMQSFVVKPASVIFLLKRSEHISMLCPSATKRYLLLS